MIFLLSLSLSHNFLSMCFLTDWHAPEAVNRAWYFWENDTIVFLLSKEFDIQIERATI